MQYFFLGFLNIFDIMESNVKKLFFSFYFFLLEVNRLMKTAYFRFLIFTLLFQNVYFYAILQGKNLYWFKLWNKRRHA
jgi:hypothetical protein